MKIAINFKKAFAISIIALGSLGLVACNQSSTPKDQSNNESVTTLVSNK